MTPDTMSRNRRGVRACTLDQLTTPQEFESSLDRAFRKAGFFRERTQTGRDWLPSGARSLTIEMEINEIGSRLAIVTDNVAHQNVQDVVVDRDRFAETRHGESKNQEGRIKKKKILRYTDKRTLLTGRSCQRILGRIPIRGGLPRTASSWVGRRRRATGSRDRRC